MGLTFELFVQSSPTRYAQRADEFLEVYCSILVLVEHVEDIVRELSRVSKGEELLVYSAKLRLV